MARKLNSMKNVLSMFHDMAQKGPVLTSDVWDEQLMCQVFRIEFEVSNHSQVPDDLPFGIIAEIINEKNINVSRLIARIPKDLFDKTPWVSGKLKANEFDNKFGINWKKLFSVVDPDSSNGFMTGPERVVELKPINDKHSTSSVSSLDSLPEDQVWHGKRRVDFPEVLISVVVEEGEEWYAVPIWKATPVTPLKARFTRKFSYGPPADTVTNNPMMAKAFTAIIPHEITRISKSTTSSVSDNSGTSTNDSTSSNTSITQSTNITSSHSESDSESNNESNSNNSSTTQSTGETSNTSVNDSVSNSVTENTNQSASSSNGTSINTNVTDSTSSGNSLTSSTTQSTSNSNSNSSATSNVNSEAVSENTNNGTSVNNSISVNVSENESSSNSRNISDVYSLSQEQGSRTETNEGAPLTTDPQTNSITYRESLSDNSSINVSSGNSITTSNVNSSSDSTSSSTSNSNNSSQTTSESSGTNNTINESSGTSVNDSTALNSNSAISNSSGTSSSTSDVNSSSNGTSQNENNTTSTSSGTSAGSGTSESENLNSSHTISDSVSNVESNSASSGTSESQNTSLNTAQTTGTSQNNSITDTQSEGFTLFRLSVPKCLHSTIVIPLPNGSNLTIPSTTPTDLPWGQWFEVSRDSSHYMYGVWATEIVEVLLPTSP